MPTLDILFVDDDIIVVDKPADLLSVPGRDPSNFDSVYSRLCEMYDEVHTTHRLDMKTSGVMIFARHKDSLRHLNKQFEKRIPQKQYQAILEGKLTPNTGAVNFPLICDWPNRPKQMICYEHGKPSLTRWHVIEYINDKTRVNYFPKTGRSHQLRLHSIGLGHRIVGDDLYMTEDEISKNTAHRMMLHAHSIELFHPSTNEKVVFISPIPF